MPARIFPLYSGNFKPRRALWFMLLLTLAVFYMQAQYVCRNYSTADGLPSATVYACLQDSAGFMWFATDKGLCRFDGSDFVDIDMDGYEGKSLTTISLAVSNNRIIAGTYGGFMLTDGLDRAWKIGVGPSDVDYENHRLAYHNDFLYYRTSDNHLAAYDLRHPRQFHIANQDISQAFCMAKTLQGRVYYGQRGLYTIDGLRVKHLDVPKLNHKELSSLHADATGQLWVSSGNTIYRLENDQVKDSVTAGFYNGNTLFVYNSRLFGLIIYDHYGNGNAAYKSLSALFSQGNVCIVTSLFEDRDGNLWVNTYNKGSYCVVNSYVSTFSGQDKIYNASILDVYASEAGEVYMATSFGMAFKTGNVLERLGAAKDYFYYGIFRARNRLLVSVSSLDSAGLRHVVDPRLGKSYYQLVARRLCLMNDSVAVYNAWQNNVVVGDIDWRNLKIRQRKVIVLDSSIGHCMAIFKKDRSHVIVATTDACYLVDVDRGTSEQMDQVKSKVNDILADASGTIYLASEAGLYILKHNRTYLVKDVKGMPLKNLSSLAIDSKGRLWIGFARGLLVWKGDFLKRISGSSYMRSTEVNKLFYERISNRLYVATNSGLSVIDIHKMDSLSVKKPDLILLKIQSGDSLYDPSGEVRLLPGNSEVDIYFSAVKLSSPEDLYFRYTLNGGRSWTMENDKKISLRSLGYGNHRVLIQASANGIDWGRQAEVLLYVDYPFYMTIPFWILVCVFGGLVVAVIVKLRIRSIQAKARRNVLLQQKMEELRYQALNAAVSPHFIFNTLGAIQSFVMNKDPFQASDYIAKFARLIRITLTYAGEKYISISEELNRLNLYLELEQLRCGHKLEYSVTVHPSVDRHVLIPNMIIQPLLENAILHGILPLNENVTGKLELTVEQGAGVLTIRVCDNGMGVDAQAAAKHGHKSIGIDNLRERLALVKGSQFTIKSLSEIRPLEKGTFVEIILPL